MDQTDSQAAPAAPGQEDDRQATSRPELTPTFKYRLLLEIFQGIQDTLDLGEILDRLLDKVAGVLAYDAAGIFVVNREPMPLPSERSRQLIAGVAMRGFDDRPIKDDPMLTLGQGIIGHVIRTGECVVASDVRLNRHYVVGRHRTRSEIAVPITLQERVIGALNLENDRLGAYGEDDLSALRFFADAAAISIEKAMLHQRILEKEQLEKQLQFAQEVQRRLLPAEAPKVHGYDIAGHCLPTHEIGGDYFDYIPLAKGQMGVVIADVSGKGAAAALIMAAFRALLRAQAATGAEPDHIARVVNELLIDSTAQLDFVTCIYGVLDPPVGTFTFVNCGHNPPLVSRSGGDVETLASGDLVLGLFEEPHFEIHQVALDPGDLLVLYTDGVVEAEDSGGVEFGVDGLADTVASKGVLSAPETVRRIAAAVKEHAGSGRYGDDFTLVLVGRH